MWAKFRFAADIVFGIYRKRKNKLKSWNVISKKYSILDIGCGIGQYSKMTEGRYLGIDLQPQYIDYCKKKHANPNKEFRCADVSTIFEEKEKFNIVLIVDILHHIPDELCTKILHTTSVLTNNFVIIFEPVYEQRNLLGKWLRDRDRGNFMRPLDKLHELFEKANLEIIESSELVVGTNTRAILAKPKMPH